MTLDATDVTYTPLLPAISPILLTDEFPLCRPGLSTPLQRCTGADIATMVLGGAPPYFFVAGAGLVGSGGADVGYGQTLSLAATGVTPGTYTNATVTVNAYGQLTAVSSGGAGGALEIENFGVVRTAAASSLDFGTGIQVTDHGGGDESIATIFAGVKDFGAVGDGVHDDTAAFILAAANGTSIYIGPGTYKLTGAVTFANEVLIQAGATLSVSGWWRSASTAA
jgi:hypothetical protein